MENRLITLRFVTRKEISDVINLWNDEQEFQQDLLRSLPLENPFRPYLETNRSKFPIRSILISVKVHFKAFALIESPYLDLEFWDSHTGYYESCFSRYPRYCSRIHFFSGDEEAGKTLKKELLAGRDESVLGQLKILYHGYSVFRPIPSYVVGRTAIGFDSNPPGSTTDEAYARLLPAEVKGRPFLKAKQAKIVTLLNAKLAINAPEFIQQDPHLGHCGTASLWVSTNIASAKFGTTHFRFPTITRHAVAKPSPVQHINSTYNPLDPNPGLSLVEIKNALAATGAGYQEVCQGNGESAKAATMRIKNFIYSYVESGIPVLLCLKNPSDREGHVVATVGHSLPELDNSASFESLQIATGKPSHANHFLVSNTIDLYYVHDDCYGPYNRIQFKHSYISTCKRLWDRIRRFNNKIHAIPSINVGLGKRQELHNLTTAIAPVHVRIRNHAWSSLLLAIDKFTEFFNKHDTENSAYMWRSFLISGNEFKQSLSSRHYSDKLKSWYATLHLPKYIWIHEFTEISHDNLYKCFSQKCERNINGEILYDATSPSYDSRLISMRAYGVLYDTITNEFFVDESIVDNKVEFECFTTN